MLSVSCIDCGKIRKLLPSEVKKSLRKRCVDCKNNHASLKWKTHGYSHKERLYNIWTGINKRCNNSNSVAYKNYGARGIKMCKEWQDYLNFRKWALSSGYNNSFTIERIDNNKGYNPQNCKWIALGEQARNTNLTKLNWKIIAKIKKEYKKGNISQSGLAKKYFVSKGHINNIIKGRVWNSSYHRKKR